MVIDKYKVLWTDTAVGDLKSIINYIAVDNPEIAIDVLGSIKKAADKLCRFPTRGRIVPKLKVFGIITYREIINDPWRLMYKIEEKRVYVLAVLDSRRNIEDILLDRFIA